MASLNPDTYHFAQYQSLSEHSMARNMNVCIKSLEKHGTLSKFYIMKKLKCDYKRSKEIIKTFHELYGKV